MSKSVVINNVTYSAVPSVTIPLSSGSGNASFYDVSDADITSAAQLRNGVSAAGSDGTIYTGTMTELSATTYNPSTSDQTINASQYLAGAQTISAVTVSNLSASYIANGVTVKVGCSADDDCIASVTGTLSAAVISQDSTSKILSIS